MAFSLEHGFATKEPTYGPDGVTAISPIKYLEEIKRRIVNADGTEIPVGGSKRTGGHPINSVLFNPSVPRPGQRTTKSASHDTGLFVVNAAGEVGPTTIISSTSATVVENRRVSVQQVVELRRVKVQFDHPEPVEFESVVAVAHKGSMDTDLLEA